MATVQFAGTLPSFAHLVLPDASPVQDAVAYVLQTLRTPSAADSSSSSSSSAAASPATPSAATLSAAISAQTGAQSVGELRALTDADFRALDVPAMLRIYLKHLVRGSQSGRFVASAKGAATGSGSSSSSGGASVDWLVSLQDDFNYGQPFDLSLYQAQLSLLAGMGFGTADALEALLLTESEARSGAEASSVAVAPALELLLSTEPAARKEKRTKLVEKLGRQAAPSRSAAAAASAATALAVQQHAQAEQQSAAGVAADASAAALLALQGELSAVRSQLAREKSARAAQHSAYASFVSEQLPLTLYREYLSSLLVKGYLLPAESAQLSAFRTRHAISPEAHAQVLAAVGVVAAAPSPSSPALSPTAALAALQARTRAVDRNLRGGGPGQASVGGNEQAPGDMDCVVCLDKPKNHIILNCMHLCLCDDCALSWSQSRGAAGAFNKNCPICSKKITQIARIYV